MKAVRARMNPVFCFGSALWLLAWLAMPGAAQAAPAARERLRMDFGWRFAFGHATDVGKDLSTCPVEFTSLATFGSHGWAGERDA